MDATAPQATKHVETSGSVPGFPELIQTETGGNDKSFDTESRFLVPTAPQPLNTFAKNFGAFDLAEYMDPGSLTGPLHLPESAQSLHHAFMHGSRQEVSGATSSGNSGVSSVPQNSNQSTFLTKYSLPNVTPSRSGFQESGAPPVIQRVACSEVATSDLLKNGEAIVVEGNTLNYNPSVTSPPSTHAPAPTVEEPLNRDQNEGVVGMPSWVVLIKPLPLAGKNIINLRRDSNFALEIILAHLPMGSLERCNGIKVPATASVKNIADTAGKTCLEFRIRLYGATTKKLYEFVCDNCQNRMGKRRGTPSLIDYKAEYDIIEQKNGKIRVEFRFCCYPKCHKLGDTEYLLDIILSKDEGQNHIVDQCRLPFSFNFLSKLPPGARLPGTRKRPLLEEDDGDPPASEQRAVRRRIGEADALAPNNHPGNGHIHGTAPNVGNQNAPRGHEEGSSGSLAIFPSKLDGERLPTLTEVNPNSGSITGGVEIWLKGMDFPALLPLFARFGAAIAPTTFSSSNLLACQLPSRTMPGVIDVTLSKHPLPNAPEYGTSIAKFKYKGEHDELISLLLRIKNQIHSPLLQAVLTALYDQGTLAPDPAINTLDPIQAQPAYHFAAASGPTLGLGTAVGQPEQLHAGVGSPSFTPTWSFPTNISGPPTHRPQDFQVRSLPTLSMNQGSNPSVPLNRTTQPYQWGFGNSFSSLDNVGAPSFSIDNPYSDNLMGDMKHNRILDAAGNSQSTVPMHGAQAMGGWHSVPTQPLLTHGESIRGQSMFEDDSPAGVSSTTNQAVQERDSDLVNAPRVDRELPILAHTPHRLGRVPYCASRAASIPPPQGPVQPYGQLQALPPPWVVEAGMRSDLRSGSAKHHFPPTEENSYREAKAGDEDTLGPFWIDCASTGARTPYENKRSTTGMPHHSLTPPPATHQAPRNLRTTLIDGPGLAIEQVLGHKTGAPSTNVQSNQEQHNVHTNASLVWLTPMTSSYIPNAHRLHTSKRKQMSIYSVPESEDEVQTSPKRSLGVDQKVKTSKVLPDVLDVGAENIVRRAAKYGYASAAMRERDSDSGPRRRERDRSYRDASSPESFSPVARAWTRSSSEDSHEPPVIAPLWDSGRSHHTVGGTQGSKALQGGNRSSIPPDVPIETGLLEALRLLQLEPNFREIISTTNEWGQTLAHLCISHGYASLLGSLVDWRINLAIADADGLTALHYAYRKGDVDSIRTLRRGGASEAVVDKLGRTPLDLQPEGFGSSVENGAKVAAELVYPLESDSIAELTRMFGALIFGDTNI